MATGTTEIIDTTTAAVFLPEIWSALAVVQRESQLIFARLSDRRFEVGLTFGDTIRVPTVTNLSARTKSLNTAVDYETQTELNRPSAHILINTWEYTAIAIESMAKVQADRNLLEMYAGKLGYGLGLAVDDVLAGFMDNSTTNTVGTLAVENDDDDLIRAIQYLDDEDVPGDDRHFVFSPAGAMGLLKLDRFVHNDYSMLHGTATEVTALEKAYVTSFYKTPIYKSTNVEGTNAAGHDNGLFHREYMSLVMQADQKAYSQFDIDFLADKVVMENIYGATLMRDDGTYGRYGVWIQGA